jgi:hypothetical protein
MKLGQVLVIAAIGGGVMVSQAGMAAQHPISTDGSNPKSWDPKTDGPVAAPNNHKIIFENDNVRIISVTVPPGTKEPYHSHARCSVLVFDSPAKVTDSNRNGVASPPVLWGSIAWMGDGVRKGIPFVWLQPPEALHSIANNDTHAVHLTRIEMKKGCDAPPKQ